MKMDRTLETEDFGVFVGGSYMNEADYRAEAYGTVQPCLNEIMFYSTDTELSEYIKNGTATEKEKAELEIAVRQCKASFTVDKKKGFLQRIEEYGGMRAFVLDGLAFYGLMAVLTGFYIMVGA